MSLWERRYKKKTNSFKEDFGKKSYTSLYSAEENSGQQRELSL